MILVDVKFFFIVIVFAYITQGKVIVVRDYDEDPFFVEHEYRNKETKAYNQLFNQNSNHKTKQIKPRHAVLHYGRHIYHLDSFDDLSKLRSKLDKLNNDYVSNGYVDLINDLIRSNHDRKDKIHPKHGQDLYIVSQRPLRFDCNDKHCEDDYRKFSKLPSEKDLVWQKKQMPSGFNKRFKIVDNAKKHRPQKKKIYKSSEESRETKKKKYYSGSSSSESKESMESKESKEENDSRETKESQEDNNSRETRESYESRQKSSESYEDNKHKKKYDDSSSRSSEERYTTRRPKKYDSQSQSSSIENFDSGSISHEEHLKKKKKKYDSDETKRKTFSNDDDVFLQGNKIYHARSGHKTKKHEKNDADRRRRLQHFLPKRFHWKASQIHDLGYYWFNGPKGRYSAPTPLQ